METPQRLTYAPTPPNDRAHVVHAADGFVLTIPPKLSWSFAFSAGLGLSAAILLIFGAVWPFGDIFPFNALNVYVRVIKAVVGFYVIYVLVDQFVSTRRGWAVITVRNDKMRVASPHLLRTSGREYWLDHYKDARTDCPESMGCLTLIRTDGTEEILLQNMVYRSTDLRFSAQLLRHAIKNLGAQYARQQVAIKVALDELRDGLAEKPQEGRG